jgi:hypothetical protein
MNNTSIINPEKKPDKVTQVVKIIVGIAFIAAVAVIAITCSLVGGTSQTSTDSPKTTSYPTITYEITGTARAVNITLNNPTGGTEQYANVGLPSKFTYDSFSDFFLYISAQNQGESGTVTVSIYVNGKLYKTSTSSGAYVIASASGVRP